MRGARCPAQCSAHRLLPKIMFGQNCRGLKTEDRITELFSSAGRHHAFAVGLQETWRAGLEERMQDGCLFIGIGPDTQVGRGSKGVGFYLGRSAVDAWLEQAARRNMLTSVRV